MPVSEETFQQLALEDPEGHWELYCGRLRAKPDMPVEHSAIASEVYSTLKQQLDSDEFCVRGNEGYVRASMWSYYIPDVSVIPTELPQPLWSTRKLEAHEAPLTLVIEVWSPPTGDYDVETKLRDYQWRGDLEIWRIHPYEHRLTAWQRQPDGTYSESRYTEGTVSPVALPKVTVDLDTLFD